MNHFEIGGFTPFTLTDFPGKVAAIVFTQGCNLACPFCHNKSLVPLAGHDARRSNGGPRQVLEFLANRRGRLQGVVITGGEPTLHEGLPVFMAEVKRLGFEIKLDTNGTNPKMLKAVLKKGLADFVAMDIKAPWHKYDLLAGTKVDIESLKLSLELIMSSGQDCLFRTTMVPGLLTGGDIDEIKSYLPKGTTHLVQKYVPPADASGSVLIPSAIGHTEEWTARLRV